MNELVLKYLYIKFCIFLKVVSFSINIRWSPESIKTNFFKRLYEIFVIMLQNKFIRGKGNFFFFKHFNIFVYSKVICNVEERIKPIFSKTIFKLYFLSFFYFSLLSLCLSTHNCATLWRKISWVRRPLCIYDEMFTMNLVNGRENERKICHRLF